MNKKIYDKLNKIAKAETPEFWDKIETNLPVKENIPIKNKKPINFNKFGLVAACLAITVVSVFAFQLNSPVKNNSPAADQSRIATLDEDSSEIGRPDIYQPIVKDVTFEEMNRQLGISIDEFENIPKDLTDKKIQLYYYDGKVVNAQISYTDNKNRFISIYINKIEKKEIVDGGQTKPAEIAPDMTEQPREIDNDSPVSNEPVSKDPVDLPATDGSNGQSSPPSQGSGDYKGDYKYEEEVLKINGADVNIQKMTNTKTGEINYYTNITKDKINYYVETKNVTVEEIKDILIQI